MPAEFKLTPAQHEAVHADGQDILVRAGAGSGKTRVLVERYIRLLRQGHDLEGLVAITFTEKAAREMRDRVRQAIEALRAQEPHNPRWHDLYLRLADAPISTIHALCARLLREYAAEAGLDPDFEILDEVEADLLADEVLEETLAWLAERQETASDLLFEQYGPEDVRRTLRELLRQGEEALRALEAATANEPLPAEAETAWNRVLEAICGALTAVRWQDRVEAVRQFVAQGPRGDKLHDVAQEFVEECGRLTSALEEGSPASALGALENMARARYAGKGQKKAWAACGLDKQAAMDALDALKEAAEEVAATARQAYEHILLMAWREALRQAHARFAERKRAIPALDFDDLEAEAARLLVRPEVADQVRSHISQVLVDEFQDTNARQVAIVRALSGPPNSGRLFVVGDAKQSIYAFRGADVRGFMALEEEIVQNGGRVVEMARSFRTHAPLVELLNTLFQPLFDGDNPEQVAFQPLEAHRHTAPFDGPPLRCVVFQDAGSEPTSTAKKRRYEAQWVAQTIRELVGHHPVDDPPRPVQYGDIALLFRATTDMFIYEDALKVAGIPFVTVAGRGFFGRSEVRDLLSLLRAVENRYDTFALMAALRSPLFGVSDVALVHLRLTPDGKWREPADVLEDEGQFEELLSRLSDADRASLTRARDVLRRLWQQRGRVSLFELVQEALNETGYLATLSGLPDGDRRRSNVEKLVALTWQRRSLSLRRFNRYVEDLATREVRESEAVVEAEDAVRLMTVHAAKGLEFPVVFLVDAGRQTRGFPPLVLVEGAEAGVRWPETEGGRFLSGPRYETLAQQAQQRAEAEEVRLLYVAATRARDLLFVSGTDSGWIGTIRPFLDPDFVQFEPVPPEGRAPEGGESFSGPAPAGE